MAVMHRGNRQKSQRGTSIVGIEDGKIIHWSDYYDGLKSRRQSLAACFTEWIEY
jgi:hypothetical protein